MAQRAGRVTCPRCGSNNFDTVTTCWKCGASIGAGASPGTAPPAQSAAYAPQAPSPAPVATYAMERPMAPQPAAYPAPSTGDPGAARRAAIALALSIPWIGLPVGWVFMMIEDARKQAIGRVCANWSLFGLVLHLIFMFVLAQWTGAMMRQWFLPIVTNAIQNSSHGGGGGIGGGLPDGQ